MHKCQFKHLIKTNAIVQKKGKSKFTRSLATRIGNNDICHERAERQQIHFLGIPKNMKARYYCGIVEK